MKKPVKRFNSNQFQYLFKYTSNSLGFTSYIDIAFTASLDCCAHCAIKYFFFNFHVEKLVTFAEFQSNKGESALQFLTST